MSSSVPSIRPGPTPDFAAVQVVHAGPHGVSVLPGPLAASPGPSRSIRWFRASCRVALAPFRLIGWVLGSFRFWLIVLLIVLGLLITYYVIADGDTPLTTDAYVQAYVVRVAPQVGGLVVAVHVGEGSVVRKGDVLFELDHRPFEHKVAMLAAKLVTARREVQQLHSQLAAEQAEHRRLSAEDDLAKYLNDRDNRIYEGGATTERKATTSALSYKASRAAVERSVVKIQHIQEAIDARVGPENSLVAQVEAELAEARLNLEYSTVHAPSDGVITNLQLREGDFAHVGEAVLSCVDRGRWLVVANYRERCLERMRPGQGALVTFRGAPGRIYRAQVFALGWGVNQGQGVPSGNLPEVPRLQNWVPPSQRFQVRLALDDPDAAPLRVGTTCTVTTITEPASPILPLTRLVHEFVALWYYF
jgi:multidrug efflux system membrane fusion protein